MKIVSAAILYIQLNESLKKTISSAEYKLFLKVEAVWKGLGIIRSQ